MRIGSREGDEKRMRCIINASGEREPRKVNFCPKLLFYSGGNK